MGRALKKYSNPQKRGARQKIIFSSYSEAVNRLKRFGAKENEGVLIIKDRLGLKVLGAVDFINRAREHGEKKAPIIVFK